MKKVNLVLRLITLCVIAIACSKESDIHQAINEAAQSDDAQMRIENSFVVGQFNEQGIAVITFAKRDLESLASCVHLQNGEGVLSDQRIERIGSSYYLRGVVKNESEVADFGYKLTVDQSQLVYEEGNSINSCTSDLGSGTCTLVINADGVAHCNAQSTDCRQASGPSFQCDWPWMIN